MGEFAKEEHEKIIRIVDDSPCLSALIAFGENLTSVSESFHFNDKIQVINCKSHADIVKALNEIAKPGDLVLFKGSHSCNLRSVIYKMWPRDFRRINHEEREPYNIWIEMVNKN